MSTPTLTANPVIVIVDVEHGQTSNTTTIHYEKAFIDEIWERVGGSGWLGPSFSKSARLQSDEKDDYPVSLKPGDTYEVGLYVTGHGPLTGNPVPLAYVAVYGLKKTPEDLPLIQDQGIEFGGTWSWHRVITKVPTSIVSIGVSRNPPRKNSFGIPLPVNPDGMLTESSPVMFLNDHKVEFDTIFPGNHYYYSVVVVDQKGNWDWKIQQFHALKRKIEIQFTKVHVLDDGGIFSGDIAEFDFWIYTGTYIADKPWLRYTIEDFQHHEEEIDTGQEYLLYDEAHHKGDPEAVDPGEMDVKIYSEAHEHGGPLDEYAWSSEITLPFPRGRSEKAQSGLLVMDCPPFFDASFHYNVSYKWSVDYIAF